MKKLFLILFLMFLYSITHSQVYLQTKKVIYSTTTGKAVFTRVDTFQVGTSTATGDIYVYLLGTGTVRANEGVFNYLFGDGTGITGIVAVDGDCRKSTNPLVYQNYNSTLFQNEFSTDVYINGKSSATEYYGDGSNLTGIAAGGAGKWTAWLLPGSVKLPNSEFARLEKITGTYGVYNVLKFDALTSDDTGFYQIPVPTSYGGGNITVTTYTLVPTTESASNVAEYNFEVRAKSHGEAWEAAYTAIGTVNINPTGTANQLLVDTIAWTANLPTAGDMLDIKEFVDVSDSTFVSFDTELYKIAVKIEED